MKAHLYCPAQKVTQSGKRPQSWILEIGSKKLYKEPIMGWTGSTQAGQTIRLNFSSKERALAYIRKNALSCRIIERNPTAIQPKSYANNFRHDRLR